MDTLTIVNEIDNAENDAELAQALETIAADIAAQFLAVHNAVRDNAYTSGFSLVAFMGMSEDKALELRASQAS